MPSTTHTPPKPLEEVGIWTKITVFTRFWRLPPPNERVRAMGGGYVDQGVVTYYSVINTKTVLQTKIPIPQSQSVHFGKIREGRCTKNAPEEPAPPRPGCQNPRFGSRSWLLHLPGALL